MILHNENFDKTFGNQNITLAKDIAKLHCYTDAVKC